MSEKSKTSVDNLITGTISGLADLYTHAHLEGLIPEGMTKEEFTDLTRKNREKSPPTYPDKNLASEFKQSKIDVANLFKNKS